MGAGSVGPGWGNGRSIATRFAEEGAKIYGVDRELDRMTETIANVKAAHSEIETSFCDVTKTDSILEAVNACIKRFGRIDILVNNVGGSAAGGPVAQDLPMLRIVGYKADLHEDVDIQAG